MQSSLQSILFYFIFSDFVDKIYLFIFTEDTIYLEGEQITANYKF